MNISWVIADLATADPTADIAEFKRIGALWGSWCTWRAFQTDNVVCHEQRKASDLLQRNFQTNCNFYIPNSIHTSLGKPPGVRLYEGAFLHDVTRQEEIVAMHLAATTSDIVLLFGFDLTELIPTLDKLTDDRTLHHRNHIRKVITDFAQVQWVIVDHPSPLDPNLVNLGNVSTDTLQAVLALASD